MAYNPRSVYKVAPYAVGNKVYGGGRPMPNLGPTGNKVGYAERDARSRARRNALLRKLKARQGGKFASPDALRTV